MEPVEGINNCSTCKHQKHTLDEAYDPPCGSCHRTKSLIHYEADLGKLLKKKIDSMYVPGQVFPYVSYNDKEWYPVEEEAKKDMVNSPDHYKDGGIETIDYLQAKLGPDGFLGYCIGNSMKYMSRAGKKDKTKTVEDYKKAIWYINKAVEALEK